MKKNAMAQNKATLNVLVVDDDLGAADALKDILTHIGYPVSVAYDGVTALDMVRRHEYDLVLVDLLMPPPNGIDIAKLLGTSYPNAKLLGVSGMANMIEVAEREHLFPHGILYKPFRYDDVEKAVTRITSGQGLP